MSSIDKAREEINRIDKEMACLFLERMRAVEDVSEYKKEHGLPILDKDREEKVIEKNSNYIEDETIRTYYIDFIKSVMKISKNYQQHLQNGIKVAYSGVEGAFAEIASKRIFPNAQKIPCSDFKSAYKAVENSQCDVAVLPIENSYAGEVGGVIDLLFSGSLHINGIYRLEIVQNLMAKKGTRIEDIKTVISHPQALSQCGEYIISHGFEIIEASNTALAAKMVSQGDDKSIAAIASVDTAKLYELDIIDHDINKSNVNTTRFAVVSKAKVNEEKNKNSVIMFTVSHAAGSLAKAINIICKYNFNMTALRSRPMKELSWQYYFYIEIDGNVESDNGRKMIEELNEVCSCLKIVGTFNDDATLL